MERLFERDLTLKVLSVCLAILLWFQAAAVTGPMLPQPVRDVPVSLTNLSQGLVVLPSSQARRVTLLVRGRGEVVRLLTKESFRAFVDLRGAGLGAGNFRVQVEAPEGITVVQITPPEIKLDIDVWESRQVPVAVLTTGAPGPDHAMRSQTTRPTDLYVEGPRSQVQLVSRVVAEVNLAGATSDIRRAVVAKPVNADGADVPGVTVTPATVDVVISVVRLPPVRDVAVRANVQGKPAEGHVQEGLIIEPATVRAWAQGAVASNLNYIWTHPIDIEGVTAPVVRDVLLLVPVGVEKVEPTVVRVTVQVAEVQEEREFSEVPLVLANLGSGLRARTEPGSLTVVVRGPRTRLAGLEPGQVTASLNLSGKGAGQHQVRPVVVVPDGLTVWSVTPAEVRVVLETL